MSEEVLTEVLTNLWRAQRKIDSSGEDPARRAAARHLRAALDALARVGWTVQDHDGARFDPGQALEVIAYEPKPDVEVETVLETVRPCVYLGTRRLQIGQVIVARPEKTRRRRV